MRRKLFKPSRILATVASFLTAISSMAFAPLPADATAVNSSNGTCTADVDNTSGVTVYQNGNYCYVAFKSTGITYTWTKPADANVFDLLVVAGGGGGGTRHAGGGGAGGLIQSTSNTINANTISISVGAGGAGAPASLAGTGVGGSSGSNSVVSANGFTTQTAIGGGAGMQASSGLNGGSGGGGSCCSGTGGTGTAGQGNSGSLGWTGSGYYLGGGGGGAGGAATNANSSTYVAGVGGSGASVAWISSTVQSALGVGVYTSGATYFAGGGGGGTAVYGTAGTGGIGGGGAGGAVSTAGTNGTANTGSGGGGGGMFSDNSVPVGGNGGSGVVVFRYAIAPVLSWNASDVNSYEETVSTTAINDLSPASNYDGALYNGTNSVAPGFDRTTGAWTFTAGAASSGPYGKVTSSISTTPFSTGGVTIDFEADFGSQANDWERVMDFSANADMADNLLVARRSTSNDMIVEVYNSNSSFGYCTYANGIPVNSGMNRWTIRLDGTNCIYYKNGTQVYSVAYTGKPRSGATWLNSYIARSNWSGDSTFEGSIRSLRLFAGGLAASDIPAPVTKTVTLNAFDGNAQNGGGVTNNMQSPRLTTGSVRLPTPIARTGYTFTGWFDSTAFSNKVGDAGGTYTPSSTVTLYGGWRSNIDSSAIPNLVMNFDATNISSYPTAGGSASSIYPGSFQAAATSVTTGARDTANSPGALNLTATTGSAVVSFPAGGVTNISGALSFEIWVKFSAINTGASAWNVIASHWFSDTAGTAATDWHLGIYNNRLQLNTTASLGTGSKVWGSTDLNKWYLVGFTLDASGNAQLYVNGKADGSGLTGLTHTTNTSAFLWIGDGRTSNTARMQGYISRARLYNAALSSAKMLNNFSGEAVTYGMGPYTLTYKAGPNGTGSDVVETYNAGVTATLKNNNAPFTRAGYYISGWTTSSVSGAAQTNALAANVSMDASLILYPVWTATTYTITYNYNGATGGNTTASATYAAGGTAITLPTPTKTSYTFGGWWSTSTFDTGTQVTGTQTPSADQTLYAKWTLVQYTITFKANDGLSTADITQTVNSGVAVNLRTNTFTKVHSSFGRWSDLASGLSLNSWTDGQSITPTSNMTFYAIWYDDARVIFNSEGGSAVADAYTIGLPLAGASPLSKPTNPTKVGKIFGGWSYQESAGNGLAYDLAPWPLDLEMNSVTTLYAVWLDACAPTKTTFTATGTSDITLATYGTNGTKYVQYRLNSTTQCAFIVPSEVTALDVLMVSGGGAGSYYSRAGGGGAGTVIHTNAGGYSVTAGQVIPMSVGAGGNFSYVGAVDGNRGTNGEVSSFDGIRVTGGGAGGGGYTTIQSAAPGGSGGGGACSTGYTSGGSGGTPIISGWTAYANSGANATLDCNTSGGGGGGGAGGWSPNGTSVGGPSITRFGIELAGGGAAWWPSATRAGGGTVGGSWTNNCSAGLTANNAVANTGSGGAACGSGAAGTIVIRFAAPTYTVSYTYNGATGGNSTTSADSVATALTLPTPTKTGYTFAGWYAEAGLTTLVGNAGASYTPTADATIYAKWTTGTYTLTYNYNGATGGNTTVSSSYTTGGTAITLPTPTKTNYTFDGWYAENTFVTAVTGTQTPSASATLYAKWTSNTFTITYNYNGATGGNTTVSSSYTTGGSAITLPAPSKTGYVFDGWFDDTVFTNQISDPFSPSASATIYAKWSPGNYTLVYNYNGATGGNTISSQTYYTGNTALTMPTPTKTGYTFGGWYAEPGFTTLVSGTQTPTASANLYAKWTAVNYTLTYSSTLSTSGTVPTDATNYNIGNNATVKANTGSLARTGYTFAGWTVASDGTGTVLSSGQTVTFASANITLYAKWTANTYAISYNVNGATGTQANASDSYTTGGTAVTLSAVGTMVKTGYNFSGWSATPTGSVIAGTYTTAADIMLYAIWTIKSISVTYSKGAAASATFISFPANTSGNYGTRVTLSNNIDSSVTFNSSTYAFVGWSDGTSLYQSGEQYLLGDTAITMTAVWVQAFGVRYIPNGGTFANGSSAVDAECLVVGNLCTNGQSITANAAPTRSGYTFTGWTDQSSNAIAAGANFTVNINSYLLYAGWTPINYTITYAPNGGGSTPTQAALHYGDTFTLANGITRTGYRFNGWNDGVTTYGAGTTYLVGVTNVTLTAQWTPLTYVITYDWNGGTGSATANGSYTVGNSGIALPAVGNHVKDGYNFGGWSETIGGNAVSTPYVPTGSGTLYAIWGSGSYSITYNLNYGLQANSTDTVANGNSTTLPTPSRSNFVFDGWYSAATGGSKIGNAGAAFTPGGSSTLYARWIQASLYGVVGNLNRISTITASDSVSSNYNGTAAGSSVSVTVPSASLPAGTVVTLDVITDTSYAQSLLAGTNNYILSIAVSWLAPDETVPNTNSGKSVSMTITNSSIKAGALVYSIQNGVVTLLGTATQNGTITVQLTSDPSVYVVATVPSAPQTIASTATGTSATVTWTAPSTDGGATITGYTVTLNNGATCTTALLTCTFNNLVAGTSYTATIVATNSVGSSVTGSTTFTPAAQQSSGSSTPVTPVTPTPPVVVPPKPVDPVVPVKPIVVKVPVVKAVEKVLSYNVPVLTGSPVISPILFNPNSAKLDATDIAMIKQAAAELKDKSGWLFVTGFVKFEGAGTAIEKKIANARATAVAKQLATLGLKVKIGYLGYGTPNKKSPKPTDRKVELRWVPETSQNS